MTGPLVSKNGGMCPSQVTFTTTGLRVALEQAALHVAEDHLWPTLVQPVGSDRHRQLATGSREYVEQSEFILGYDTHW